MDPDLEPLPIDDRVVDAVRALVRESPRYGDPRPTANAVARYLGVRGARRAGNGAAKGSWSGTMSPALRIAPRLRALARAERLDAYYDRDSYRYVYSIPGEAWWKR